jgi:hypothetical protein
MALSNLIVGPTVNADGSAPLQRAGRTGETMVSDTHAHFAEAAARGNAFIGADLGGTPVTTQAGLSATTPALTLYNPVGSGKNLIVMNVNISVTAAPAANCNFWLAYNLATAAAPSSVTAATVTPAVLGNTNTGVAGCYRVATLPAAPLMIETIGTIPAATTVSGFVLDKNIDGRIVVGPGVALSIQTGSAAAIVAAITWEEIPL